jgi:hypothetical protein
MSALHPIATAKADAANVHVCFTPKADMCGATWDVRFGPKADIDQPQQKDRFAAVSPKFNLTFFWSRGFLFPAPAEQT